MNDATSTARLPDKQGVQNAQPFVVMPRRYAPISAFVAAVLFSNVVAAVPVAESRGASAPENVADTAGQQVIDATASEPEAGSASRANTVAGSTPPASPWVFDFHPRSWVQPQRIQTSLQLVLTMSVLSLAPALLLMTTSFVRISVVLGLLRQAIGTPQIPPPQVTTSISVFMTLLIMWPVWSQVHNDAIKPYTNPETGMTPQEAWQAAVKPVRSFMARQIEATGNSEDVWLFMRQLPEPTNPSTYDEVPLQALLPAFVLSELKTAFLIGFQVYLPFLVIDIVATAVTITLGMVSLPPVIVSLPLKLLMFVLVDGWHLIVGMLIDSFAQGTG
jgi:flagellar biosynthetic protein FliP